MASSEINDQACIIEQLLTPVGVGIATNTSSSLFPLAGSLAYDNTTPGSLYIGTGSSWVGSSHNPSPMVISGTTLTKAGQPNITVRSVYINQITAGPDTMKSISINVIASVATTAGGIWQSPDGVVPANFLPVVPISVYYTAYLPGVISGTAAGFINTNFFINTNGAIGFISPINSADTLNVYTFTGVYM